MERSKEKELSGEKVFSKILYSQLWEDPQMHFEAFSQTGPKRIAAIASAGDNVLAHLLHDPEEVFAIDFNYSQIALTALKMEAFRRLGYEEMIAFLGVTSCTKRWKTYCLLRDGLPQPASDFWDKNKKIIEAGIIHGGRFESYFHKFQKYVLPLTHSKKVRKELFIPRDKAGRREFYDERWNNWRGKLLFRLFFSELVMARLARSKAQFAHVEAKDISRGFLERAEFAMTGQPVDENYFLQYIILGSYTDLQKIHPCLLRENFDIIRSRISRIKLIHKGMGEFAEEMPAGSISAWNLSDIFEYFDKQAIIELGKQIHKASEKDAIVSYWDFLILHKLSEYLPGKFRHLETLSKELHKKDKGFFYTEYVAERVVW